MHTNETDKDVSKPAETSTELSQQIMKSAEWLQHAMPSKNNNQAKYRPRLVRECQSGKLLNDMARRGSVSRRSWLSCWCSIQHIFTHQSTNACQSSLHTASTHTRDHRQQHRKVKIKSDLRYSAAYTSQNRKGFSHSKVAAADWHKLMTPQHIMWPTIHCLQPANNWSCRAARKHITTTISH